ncbi:MAG: hypothetical protein M1816_000316 [Peltula sp. TS41687]|nr:MAG: hypothetical protein M1816_000316 [Peltula sp. TS41687]
MLAQRVARQSLQRLARRPYLAPGLAASKYLAPLVLSPSPGVLPYTNLRPVATQKLPPSESSSLLTTQRLNRPVSPHLSIYRPQITWYVSGTNRITGSILSGAFYLYFASYLIAPLLGWHLESQVLATSFAALPLLAKVGIKFVAALPFTFHSFAGIRHLVWDFGLQLRNIQVARTGWAVVGASVASAVALAVFV